jgi:hypothetical protein
MQALHAGTGMPAHKPSQLGLSQSCSAGICSLHPDRRGGIQCGPRISVLFTQQLLADHHKRPLWHPWEPFIPRLELNPAVCPSRNPRSTSSSLMHTCLAAWPPRLPAKVTVIAELGQEEFGSRRWGKPQLWDRGRRHNANLEPRNRVL